MAFATSSSTFSRYRPWPLRFSCFSRQYLDRKTETDTLYYLHLTFKERFERRDHSHSLPSHGIHSLTPLHRNHHKESTPHHCTQRCSGHCLPNSNSCSTLAVSHRPDGLLLSITCKLVASCFRSWGSPCFIRLSSRHLHAWSPDKNSQCAGL